MKKIETYYVGGCVRDELMGIKPKDIDIAIVAPSYAAMKNYIESTGATIFLETPEFFTIRASSTIHGAVDYVLCRKDGVYRDGRHPDSVEMGTIHDDLARRDFTVNAIAKNTKTGEIIDPYHGQIAIERKLIRAVGDPVERFTEDKLRMYRAIRFAITKKFDLDYFVQRAMEDIPIKENEISADRVREELAKCFDANTLFTLQQLNMYPTLKHYAFDFCGIKLQPTLKTKIK